MGAALIAVGANLLVNKGNPYRSAFRCARIGYCADVCGSQGTSLPELVTAITALAKGHGALSLGNIIGANLS